MHLSTLGLSGTWSLSPMIKSMHVHPVFRVTEQPLCKISAEKKIEISLKKIRTSRVNCKFKPGGTRELQSGGGPGGANFSNAQLSWLSHFMWTLRRGYRFSP